MKDGFMDLGIKDEAPHRPFKSLRGMEKRQLVKYMILKLPENTIGRKEVYQLDAVTGTETQNRVGKTCPCSSLSGIS